MGELFFPRQPEAKPVRMPVASDPDNRSAAAAQRKAIGQRSGRTSTILTRRNNGGTAGTQAYTNSLLGQAV